MKNRKDFPMAWNEWRIQSKEWDGGDSFRELVYERLGYDYDTEYVENSAMQKHWDEMSCRVNRIEHLEKLDIRREYYHDDVISQMKRKGHDFDSIFILFKEGGLDKSLEELWDYDELSDADTAWKDCLWMIQRRRPLCGAHPCWHELRCWDAWLERCK